MPKTRTSDQTREFAQRAFDFVRLHLSSGDIHECRHTSDQRELSGGVHVPDIAREKAAIAKRLRIVVARVAAR